MAKTILSVLLLALLAGACIVPAAETTDPGKLLIIGGGLRPGNAAIFQSMIDAAGGRDQARFVVFPTAAKNADSAREFSKVLERYGVPGDHITIVDLTSENAGSQAFSPCVVDEVKRATGAFFTGGDQSRITRSLLKQDGTPTPVLVALKEMRRRRSVIAGTSAGAAMQSSHMLSVSGLPDDTMDEGMDALDFGIRTNLKQRGLLVTQGLGFFTAGIVDQHFSQYRGRLARLLRALINQRVRFGFGIDENTAMLVSENDEVEVVGYGNLTIVDAKDAKCVDGPLGCRIFGAKVSFLQKGDRFNPSTGRIAVRPKTPIIEGKQDFAVNHLITDMAAPGAVPWAMVYGLAENMSRKQEGIALRYNGRFAHGYCYTFVKTPQTVAYGGYVDNFFSYAVDGVVLDIRPIVGGRQDPQEVLPLDLPSGAPGDVLKSIWFRGILLADDRRRLRPSEPILRGEFANAVAQTIHLERRPPVIIADVASSAEWAEDIHAVVAAGLLKLDANGRFQPDQAVTRLDAARALSLLHPQAEKEGQRANKPVPGDIAGLLAEDRAAVVAAVNAGLIGLLHAGRFESNKSLTRQDAATALCRLIGFPWATANPPR
jgi:cyanophycinase